MQMTSAMNDEKRVKEMKFQLLEKAELISIVPGLEGHKALG